MSWVGVLANFRNKKRLKDEKLFLSEMEDRHSTVTYKRAIIEQQKSIIFILEMLKDMAEDT